MDTAYKIGIIGTGNVAHFLGNSLQLSAHPIQAIYGRNPLAARQFAEDIAAIHYQNLEDFAANADIIFLAVNDDAVASVVTSLAPYSDKMVIHFSGTLPLSVLNQYFEKSGVFWPIYAINSHHLPDHKNIPIIINATQDEVQSCLLAIAAVVTNHYAILPEEQRKALHLMAVMTNNFMNHLAGIAQDFGKEKGVPFDWVIPIIQQTTARLQDAPCIADLQTGPAIRNDEQTMNNHLSLLAAHPDWQELYQVISQSILAYPKQKL